MIDDDTDNKLNPTNRDAIDVVVVGAGITGLSAAHELAERGFRVVVVSDDKHESNYSGKKQQTVVPGGVASSQWIRLSQDTSTEGDYLLESKPYIPPILTKAESGFLPTDPDTSIDHFELRISKSDSESFATIYSNYPFVVDQSIPEGYMLATAIPKYQPGEHGFRFFPAFYRNLFDTMRRTPQVMGAPSPDDGSGFRTVFDNLVPVDAIHVGLGRPSGDDRGRPFAIPRRAIRSLEEFVTFAEAYLRRLDVRQEDIAQYLLELLKWATSCGSRRAQVAGDDVRYAGDGSDADPAQRPKSWYQLIEADKHYSKGFQTHLRASSMAFVGMLENEIDARTYANISLQLLLDTAGDGSRVDYTLNGPTSSAWFHHWKVYLQRLGVRFAVGTFKGFHDSGRPDLHVDDTEGPIDHDSDVDQRKKSILDFVKNSKKPIVLALSLQGLMTKNPTSGGSPAWLQAWKKAAKVDSDGSTNPHKMKGTSPFRSMVGVQYYRKTFYHLEKGHYYLPFSPWSISAMPQETVWRNRAWPDLRGIISIDICDMLTPDANGQAGVDVNRATLARRAWEQLKQGLNHGAPAADGVVLPDPHHAHVDRYLENEGDRASKNMAPYLINYPGHWAYRPGQVKERLKKEGRHDDIRYEVVPEGGYVIAGPHAKTWTRLATMEAANESGRHAANAVLRFYASNTPDEPPPHRPGKGPRVSLTPVPVFNPEDHEVPDLEFLKEVDDELMRRGVPHLFDVLDLREQLRATLTRGPEREATAAMSRVLRRKLGALDTVVEPDLASALLRVVKRAIETIKQP